VTDGRRVYAYFGSQGLYALDTDGGVVWETQLGRFTMRANFGEGTSPVLCGDMVVVCQDHDGPSFIVALDSATGQERWRKQRDEKSAWSTPLVVERGGRRQIIVPATNRIRAYDPATGDVLWECGGMTGNVVPRPVEADGIVYCMSGFRGAALLAIRLDKAKGDVTGDADAVVWSRDEDTPYVPSPLLYGDLLYFGSVNRGMLSCVEAATGKVHYEAERLEGIRTLYASPLGAAGRVYVPGREGTTVVLRHGPALEVLATNELDDAFTASPAAVGGELFLRGHGHLYCIARDAAE
jgi:outer membrane protein assembly factor BamB